MKPTIEEVREWLSQLAKLSPACALRTASLSAALDVAEAASRCVADETGADGLIEAVEAFRATIAPSPGATSEDKAVGARGVAVTIVDDRPTPTELDRKLAREWLMANVNARDLCWEDALEQDDFDSLAQLLADVRAVAES